MRRSHQTTTDEKLVGYWDLITGDVTRFIDNSLKVSLGYRVSDFSDTFIAWKLLILPVELIALYRNYLLHIKSATEVPFMQRLNLKQKDGSRKNFIVTGKIIEWDGPGKPKRISGSHIDMSPVNETEAALLQYKKWLELSTEITRTGGWEIDLATDKITWTMAAADILELPEGEDTLSGMATTYFKYEIDKQFFKQALRESVKSGKPFNFEQIIITAKQNEKWIHSWVVPEFTEGVCSRVVCLFVDVTDQKTKDDALRIKQEQLNILINNSPAEIAILDKDLRYVSVNEAWKKSYNLGEKSLVGQKHYHVFPEIPERWKKLHQRCLHGEAFKNDLDNFVRTDGKIEWLQWEIRPWSNGAGQLNGIIILTNVITKVRTAEQELQTANKSVEDAVQTKSRFLSVMSHELRTPLNAILGFTNLLLDNPEKDKMENLNIIKFSANNLLVLINDLLDFHNIEAGKIALEDVEFNIASLLKSIAAIHQREIDQQKIRLDYTVDPLINKLVKADQVRITQVINNLLNNAIKFTQNGHIGLSAKLLEDGDKQMEVLFAVSDTGIGIPPDKQKLIFDDFAQTESETKRKYGGIGIGLAVVKRLLGLMDSNVHVVSKFGEGAAFSFVLKLRKVDEPAAELAVAQTETKVSALRGLKILLVEDNPINSALVKKVLTGWQAKFDWAENGRVALKMVLENDYDIVLMDLQMPEMDGYEATIAIRKQKHKKYKLLPILALTASAELNMIDKIKKAGMNDCIRKPFKPAELYEKLIAYTSGII